jgi:hypothetical protein
MVSRREFGGTQAEAVCHEDQAADADIGSMPQEKELLFKIRSNDGHKYTYLIHR